MFLSNSFNRHLATLILVFIVSWRQTRVCATVGLSTGLLTDPDDDDEDKAILMSRDRSALEIEHRKTLRDGTYFELPRKCQVTCCFYFHLAAILSPRQTVDERVHTIRKWHVKGSFRHHPDTTCKRIGKFYVFGDIHHATLLLTVPKSDVMHKFYVSCRGLLQVPIPRLDNYSIRYLLPMEVVRDDIYSKNIPLSCLQDRDIMPHFEVVLASEDCSSELLDQIHTWILLSGPVKS
ncbi:hypothetical protein LSH36_127g09006 [Paralvinella palmiformis]|uniref:Uncharacterized protein n=1 Tax=Paralvinella palmiformis TaxID=53620 RepID=A0AAD9JXZ1_9ANNE|nr:hypothetical protein LSH36_127g09006 [Paralvinella palmiformis]